MIFRYSVYNTQRTTHIKWCSKKEKEKKKRGNKDNNE